MESIREEAGIQREIIRRALLKARAGQEEEERLLGRKDTLDTLREMTGLDRCELERIADGVITSRGSSDAGLFSVKHQIFYTAVMVFAFLGIPTLTIWLL